MAEFDIKDISIMVDGVEIIELASGGDTGISPHDDMKPKYGEGLKGELIWSNSPSTHCVGAIEVFKTSSSLSYLLDKAIAALNGKTAKIAIISNNNTKTKFKEISAGNCKIFMPEYKVKKDGAEAVSFKFEGNEFTWLK